MSPPCACTLWQWLEDNGAAVSPVWTTSVTPIPLRKKIPMRISHWEASLPVYHGLYTKIAPVRGTTPQEAVENLRRLVDES